MTAAPELLLPAALRLGAALAVGLGGVSLAERRGASGLFVRWRTWAVIAPLWVAAAVWPAALLVGLTAVCVQVAREYARLVGLGVGARRVLIAVSALSTPVLAVDPRLWSALPPVLLLGASLVPLVRGDAERGARDLAWTALGAALPWLLGHLWLIREEGGPGVLLALGVAVAASDVGAYVAGRRWGRRPLAPAISPAKTRAGAVGNLVGAAAGLTLCAFALPPALALALVPVVGVGCVWGDLFESLLKRGFGAKDAGGWLPGFGGLLDRVDSLLVVAPLSSGLLAVVT